MGKKGDFENPKVQKCNFSTRSVPNQCGFPIVRFPGDQKTALTKESLYLIDYQFGCHIDAAEQQRALNFKLVVSD